MNQLNLGKNKRNIKISGASQFDGFLAWCEKHQDICLPAIASIINPNLIIGCLLHNSPFDTIISYDEVEVVARTIMGFYIMQLPDMSILNIPRRNLSLDQLNQA